jgi:iron complex outermembrane receptor protein
MPLLCAGTDSFGENQQTVLGALAGKHRSEMIVENHGFSAASLPAAITGPRAQAPTRKSRTHKALWEHQTIMPKYFFVLLIGALMAAAPALLSAQNQIPTRQETLVVTGEPQAVPADEVDRAVSVLDTRVAPELYRSSADYLFLDPSVDLQQRAPNGIQGDLSIRGATFDQTLVLVNGFRVNDAQSGHHNLDVPLPDDALQRVEVLRGAGSTLYGSDALGGVVNFIAAPPAVSELRMGAGGGSFDTNEQHLSAGYAGQAMGEQFSVARDFSEGFEPDRDYRSLALASTTRLKSGVGDSTILLGYSDRPFGAGQFYGDYSSWERTKAWLAALSQQLGQHTEFDLGYRRHTDNFILVRDDPALYANNHETESWQAALRRRQPLWQAATFFYGAEGYRDSIDSNNLGRHTRNRVAGYADFDVRALRRFSFTAGVREEVYGDYRTELSPGANAGVWLSSRLKLRGSVNHAFCLPTYTDLYYSDPVDVGNPNLLPETAWSYEGGADFQAFAKLTAALTVFQRRERNGIDYKLPAAEPIATAGNPWQAANIDKLTFTGAEVALRAPLLRGQQFQLGYTAMQGSLDIPSNVVTKYSGNYPSQSAVLSWQGTMAGKVTGRSRMGVVRRQVEGTYMLWDAALMRPIGRVSPYVQVANLTNTSYWDIQNVNMPGRSFTVGMEVVITKTPKP